MWMVRSSSLMMPAASAKCGSCNDARCFGRSPSNAQLDQLHSTAASAESSSASKHSQEPRKKAAHLSIGKMNLSIVCSNDCHRCGELSNHTESSSTTPSQKSTTLPMFEVKHVGTTEPVLSRVSQRGGEREVSFVPRDF